ncbi:outer membrane beta-barrel protein [Candidatus Fermentibacteria bacterium]|nr:outer membrane beta-barrel protein [Candidatus Fermentibacteria bacterium]
MRPAIVSVALMLMLALPALAAEKGHISVTATASIYDPPGDAGASPMLGLRANYWLSSKVALAGNVSWTKYDDAGTSITYVPVSIDGILHPLGSAKFDPYVGAGLGLNYRSWADDSRTDAGVEFLAGLAYRPGGSMSFDFEVKRRIEDLSDTKDSGSWSFGGGITGTWSGDL